MERGIKVKLHLWTEKKSAVGQQLPNLFTVLLRSLDDTT